MYIVSSESAFDAAHFLTNYEGKCKNIHGHRWRIVAEVKGELNNGMLIDFGILKKDLKVKLLSCLTKIKLFNKLNVLCHISFSNLKINKYF